MIFEFNKKKTNDKMGNKAKFLIEMKNAKYNVPNGFVLDSNTYIDILKSNKIDTKIKRILSRVNKENIDSISEEIRLLFDKVVIDEKLSNSINDLLSNRKKYAVRSSGTKEDLDNYSFAGQYETFLNVSKDDVLSKVIECYKSMFSNVILSYLVNNDISLDNLSMSVIIQEMVNSDYSGICFTIDPVTGNDKTMLIEVGKGLGENIVSGKNKPEQYHYDWYNDKYNYRKSNKFLNKELLKNMTSTFFEIQQYFGYPCDIEFAISKEKLYILQARRITKIKYQGYDYIWTTADFKDGGVSASVCTPYMWSLYEYIWEYSLKKFLIDSKILKEKEIPKKLGDMFYGRCYWNLSAVKKAMSRVIGYKEREFDSEYGIKPTYEGDGQTTKVSLKSLTSIARMALAQKKILKERNTNAEKYKADLLNKYETYKYNFDNNCIEDITSIWYKLTHEDYLQSETTYFWQIFINTIHQSLYKDGLLKYVSEAEYLVLLSCIDNISHLLPFYDMWEISRCIKNNNQSLSYWRKNDINKIVKDLSKTDKYYFDMVKELICKYGYHSDKELDVTYPCYFEDVNPIVSNIKDMVTLDEKYSPEKDKLEGQEKYKKILKKLSKDLSSSKYKKIDIKVKKMRKMLWWREEFRDVSTRFYYLIRVYTIRLAEYLVSKKVLNSVDDVWYLKVGNLWDYLDGKINKKDLNLLIDKNKKYYNAYRNYMSENEIGNMFGDSDNIAIDSKIKGLGANNGKVTGVARVIKSFDEIGLLQEGDILVTKFTDTGWTPKFAILSGIVTEYGGILCHAAIVSREYGIPCIVSCTDAMKKINDGDIITIDGATGVVVKEK